MRARSLQEAKLLGRGSELAALHGFLDGLTTGEGTVVSIVGEPGTTSR